MKLPTVRIQYKGGFVTINERDFNPKEHSLYVEDSQSIAAETPPATETPDEAPTLTRDERLTELDGMPWQSIRTLHEDTYQLGDYPAGEKDDAIAAILVAEGYAEPNV